MVSLQFMILFLREEALQTKSKKVDNLAFDRKFYDWV
jgi:hypothetical protein